MTKLNVRARINRQSPNVVCKNAGFSWDLGRIAFGDPLEDIGRSERKRSKARRISAESQ